MKFGLGLPVFEERGEKNPFGKTFELARLADELGFDVLFTGHHSYTVETDADAFAMPAAPFVLLSAIATQTERVKLGTAIYLVSLHHPVSTAEQVATLDHISNGRVILGVGAGYRPYEFDGYRLDYEKRGRRVQEAIEIMRQGWTTGRYNYDGQQFKITNVDAYPLCVQKPCVPIWIGVTAYRAQRRAARYGDGWLSDMMQSLPDIERLANRYRELCAEEGRKATVCIMRNAWVAPTLETLAEEWGDAAYRFFKGYWEAGARGRDQGDVFQRLAAGEHVSAAALSHDRAIAGTPEICIEQIQRWYEKTRFDYLYLGFTERRNYQALKRSIELFAREVMPAFK